MTLDPALQVLVTVPLGALAQLLVFFGLRRLAGLGARPAALIIALAAPALYLPYALVDWPGGDVVAMHLAVFLVLAYALALVFGRLDEQTGPRRFHWAPAAIIAFFVALILFDGVLVVVSDRGLPGELAGRLLPRPRGEIPGGGEGGVHNAFPGVVARDYQKKEAQYNAFLDRIRVQEARGWQVHKGWLGEARAGAPATLQVEVLDAAGGPVDQAEVQGRFLRPSDSRLDQDFGMEPAGQGRYRAELTLPEPGIWDLHLLIRRGDDRHELIARTSLHPAQ